MFLSNDAMTDSVFFRKNIYKPWKITSLTLLLWNVGRKMLTGRALGLHNPSTTPGWALLEKSCRLRR